MMMMKPRMNKNKLQNTHEEIDAQSKGFESRKRKYIMKNIVSVVCLLFIGLTNALDDKTIDIKNAIPDYWENTGEPRAVVLAIYPIGRKTTISNERLSSYFNPMEPLHTEIQVGSTAFALAAIRNGSQNIVTRSTEISIFFMGKYQKERSIEYCLTTRTDLEIYEYVWNNFRALYHMTKMYARVSALID